MNSTAQQAQTSRSTRTFPPATANNWMVIGYTRFLSHPQWWLRPIIGTLALVAVVLAIFSLGLYFVWPNEPTIAEASWAMEWLVHYPMAIGKALLITLLTWLIGSPILMGMAYESLSRAVLRKHGAPLGEEKLLASIHSSLIVLKRSLGWRILWPCLSLLCLIIPFGAFLHPAVCIQPGTYKQLRCL